jgi:hypothetical protein
VQHFGDVCLGARHSECCHIVELFRTAAFGGMLRGRPEVVSRSGISCQGARRRPGLSCRGSTGGDRGELAPSEASGQVLQAC